MKKKKKVSCSQRKISFPEHCSTKNKGKKYGKSKTFCLLSHENEEFVYLVYLGIKNIYIISRFSFITQSTKKRTSLTFMYTISVEWIESCWLQTSFFFLIKISPWEAPNKFVSALESELVAEKVEVDRNIHWCRLPMSNAVKLWSVQGQCHIQFSR